MLSNMLALVPDQNDLRNLYLQNIVAKATFMYHFWNKLSMVVSIFKFKLVKNLDSCKCQHFIYFRYIN